MVRTLVIGGLLVIAHATALLAQEGSIPTASNSCTYQECGLGIAPRLTSLDVVRGSQSELVARLGFFWSSDIRPVFASSDSALAYADQAVRTRRAAAAFTDTGILLLGIAAAMVASDRDLGRAGAAVVTGGAILLGVSYPMQLRADGHLSRAVWWYNSRFTR
jgi:hypothetical protein